MKRLIEAIVDLCYPPELGERPIRVWRSLVIVVLLALTIVPAFLLS